MEPKPKAMHEFYIQGQFMPAMAGVYEVQKLYEGRSVKLKNQRGLFKLVEWWEDWTVSLDECWQQPMYVLIVEQAKPSR